MNTPPPLDTEETEEFRQILAELRAANPNQMDYLLKRKANKAFYLGDAAIEAHYLEITTAHANELLEARLEDKAQKETSYYNTIKEYNEFLEDINEELSRGASYLTLDALKRNRIENIFSWIRNIPPSQWTEWHLSAVRLIDSIPDRNEVLAFSKAKEDTNINPRWEHLTISVKLKGANWGVLGAFMEQGISDTAAAKLKELGHAGWEVASIAPIVYGGGGATGSALLIILKRKLKGGH